MRRPRSRSYLWAAGWLVAGSLLEQAGRRHRLERGIVAAARPLDWQALERELRPAVLRALVRAEQDRWRAALAWIPRSGS